MIRKEGIEGYNIIYSLEELKIIPQYKKSFAVPENENIPYYLNKNTCKLEGEDFRPYPQNNIIEVSNYGRIKRGDSISDQIDDLITHNIFYTAITRAKHNLKIYSHKVVQLQ